MEPSKPVVEIATPADLADLVALVESAYRGDASRAGWTTEADLLDGQRIDPQVLAADLKRPGSQVLIVRDGAGLLACAHVEAQAGAGYFGMFAVRPGAQATGVGSALLKAAEAHVRDRLGLPSMRMTVIDLRTELITWYQRRGYRLTGETAPFPYGDERFGKPRRDDLRFVVLEKSL